MRGISVARLAKLLFAIALGAQLGACATDQPRDEVHVRVGPEPFQAYRAEPYASLYVQYAMISSLAYTGRQNLNPDLCPEPASLDRQKDAEAIAWMRSLNARKWKCLFGLSETLPCPRRYLNCNSTGIADLQVWRRDDPFCSELVIAFRGVNLLDPSDWFYLRWLAPRFDPYQQVQARIETIAAMTGCLRAGTRMVAVGHSLGGGLAEATAYTDGRIRYVYAFNSFPVGGFVGSDPAVQARNKIGLGVDNVYEAGEIADIPQLLLKGPGTACNPRIRTVQFNLIPFGLPIEKHRIDTLTMNMLELSRRGISPRSALGYAAAARCSEMARMFRGGCCTQKFRLPLVLVRR
jgi:hypothetical protein